MVECVDKEVRFDQYCLTCKNRDKAESVDICDECLAEPCREYSHKPVNYEAD